jgi:osmotically-inducible protein OsmY
MAERGNDRDRSGYSGEYRTEYRGERGYGDRDRGERGAIDRAGDEVRSWFGDDDAARRRRMDDAREGRYEGDLGDRAARAGERAWERTRETASTLTDRDRDGRRGLAEWRDNDRPWDRPRDDRYGSDASRAYPTGYAAPDYEGLDPRRGLPERLGGVPYRQRGFGDTSRYANADRSSTTSWNSPSHGIGHDALRPNYTGRGPRGYQRTDDRIREDVCDWLTDDPRIDASDVEVQVMRGEVTLAGSVRSRDEKRFAEDVVERITGVREVNNGLKVRPADDVIGTARSGSSVLGLTDNPPATPTKTK